MEPVDTSSQAQSSRWEDPLKPTITHIVVVAPAASVTKAGETDAPLLNGSSIGNPNVAVESVRFFTMI